MSLISFATMVAFVCIAKSIALVQEDLFIPEFCMNIAENTDHVLLQYEANVSGNENTIRSPPFELQHLILNTDSSPLHQGIKGMCPDSTRKLQFTIETGNELSPLFPPSSRFSAVGAEVSITVTVVRVTGAKDYQIFDAIKTNDIGRAMDLISEHIGINAFDEVGQTPLMIAAQNGSIQLIASLLNARMPKVNVNLAKASGYNALFYSINLPQTTILEALLRRGANPNTALLAEDSKGNTPLHFACLFEKPKHAMLLLEYGADPLAVNVHGQTPLELLPTDAVTTMKMKLARAFKDSIDKKNGNYIAHDL